MKRDGRKGKTGRSAGEGWWLAMLGALEAGVSTESDLVDFAIDNGGSSGAAAVITLLRDLNDQGALTHVLHDHGRFLAECLGDVSSAQYAEHDDPLLMSPHVFFRPFEGATVVGTATRSNEIRVQGDVAKHLLDPRFAQGAWTVRQGVDWLCTGLPGHSGESLHGLISVLLRAGVFLSAPPGPITQKADTRMWEFHDLLFHTRTTQGHGATRRQGKTDRFSGTTPPEPALRRHNWPHYVSFSPTNGRDSSTAFWDVVHKRRSPPDGCSGADDIELSELAQFLSVLMVTGGPSDAGGGYEVTRRLYPGAGACYELDAFVLISRCPDVERGLYYYDAAAHALCKVCGWGAELDLLAANAARATGRIASASALVLLAARFERIAWKYEGIAYALCLKNVGVLLQSMYLAGAAVGLEVCALGSVDAGLFSQAVGSELFKEPLVGQFMIVGKRHDG
jgi:SagB-type dehydrogenase family enzyme